MSAKVVSYSTKALRKLLAEATPGPYSRELARNERGQIEAVIVGAVTAARADGLIASTGAFPDKQSPADADLIVAALNALPGLLDRLDRPGRR